MLSEVWKYSCMHLETTAAITPQIAKIVKSLLWVVSSAVIIKFFFLADYEPWFPAPWGAQVKNSPTS